MQHGNKDTGSLLHSQALGLRSKASTENLRTSKAMFKQSIFQSRTVTGNEGGYWVVQGGHAKPFFKANLELIFFFRSTKRNAKKELLGLQIWALT